MARRTVLAGLLLALLAACASAPVPERAARPPMPGLVFGGGEARGAADPAIDRWWLLFDDPQLHRRTAEALVRNDDLAIAAARLRAARAQLDLAAGAALPGLDLSASSGRSRTSEQAIGQPGVSAQTGNSHRLAITAGHEIDLWGRLSAGTTAARERLQAQAWARQAIEWSLSAQVAEAHFTQRAVQRQRDIVLAVRSGRQRQVELYRAALAAGTASELDLRRAEAELGAAQASEAALARRALALENGLAILTGTALPDLERVGHDTPAPLDPAAEPAVPLPAGELSALLTRRPDLRRAESELAAAQADLAQARAATLPSVRLSGSVGSDVREVSSLLNGPGFAWSLAASLVQPLFDGGQARARVHERAARADAALVQYRQAVTAAVLDVREAYLALQLGQDSLAAERRRVEALAQAVRLARTGLRAGVLTQLDALDAERNLFQAQLAEVDAYRDRLLGQVQAFKALGGGHGADATGRPTAQPL